MGKEKESATEERSHYFCLLGRNTAHGLSPSCEGAQSHRDTWAWVPEARWLRRNTRWDHLGQEFLPKCCYAASPSCRWTSQPATILCLIRVPRGGGKSKNAPWWAFLQTLLQICHKKHGPKAVALRKCWNLWKCSLTSSISEWATSQQDCRRYSLLLRHMWQILKSFPRLEAKEEEEKGRREGRNEGEMERTVDGNSKRDWQWLF